MAKNYRFRKPCLNKTHKNKIMKTTANSKLKKVSLVTALTLLGASWPALATVINFEDLTAGPSLFGGPPQTIVSQGTTLTGGVILTHTSNLPANQTSVYGSADVKTGLSNPVMFSNPNGFNNFFFDLINGNTTPTSFLISDNAGHSAQFDNVPSNTSSGSALVGFASTGTQVSIQALGTGFWDFFVDNINFDVALPPSLGPSTAAPDAGSTAWLLVGSMASLAAIRSFRRKLA